MKKVSALDLRQCMGKVVKQLERTGEPVLLEKNRRPVAVLISLRDFEERFAQRAAENARQDLLDAMDALVRPSVDDAAAETAVRELRGAL